MSKIQEILNKLNEQTEVLTKETVIEIIKAITFEEPEFSDEDLKEYTFNTMYNEYKAYGFDTYQMVMPYGDYQNYLKDIANEFAQCLPDKFEYYFNTDELYQDMLKMPVCLYQSIQFINKNSDEDYYAYEIKDSGDYNNISYVILKETIVKEAE